MRKDQQNDSDTEKEDLKRRIRKALNQGQTKEEIYQKLLNADYTVEEIQECVASVQDNFDSSFKAQPSVSQSSESGFDFSFVHIISILGALLVGAGIISIMAANWQETSDELRVGVIVVCTLVAYGIGWFLRENQQLTNIGNAVLLLGNIIFGAGIFLVGQIYNLPVQWPDGFILWTLGSLVLAMVTRIFAIFYMTIGLAFMSVVSTPFLLFSDQDPYMLGVNMLPWVTYPALLGSVWWLRRELPEDMKQRY